MSFWRRMFGKGSRRNLSPQRLDYLNEALALERQGDFEAALTSYRLAFRDNPADSRILLNMAIAFTKTGQPTRPSGTTGGRSSWTTAWPARTTASPFCCSSGETYSRRPSTCEPFSPDPPKDPTPSGGSATPKAHCATSRAARLRGGCDPVGCAAHVRPHAGL